VNRRTARRSSSARFRQSSGKRVVAWAIEGDFDEARVRSNTFTLEWPPGSGQQREFPEIDRAGWFDTATAREKLVKGQRRFIDILELKVLGTDEPLTTLS
jgi:predicted NUDIX family NTP pyrophosphohydrolase